MKRNATANWKGTGKEGKGILSSQTGVLNKTNFTFDSRFAEGSGTSPEELVAAAHAGCFSMKLSFVLVEAGCTADDITTVCTITLEDGVITQSHLDVKAKVPGIKKEKFEECAENARANCPVSKLLNAKITIESVLL